MDYDDNDFQSQNLHLAGEGSANCPPVLQPFGLPKFDFDDSLQGHLRFDSLVETEVFLGIESSEANNWIEDFSRGSSGIEFSSSAVESCSISRRNNVWSEATSSESVEMLLKSVGQEEIIPAHTIFEESDAGKEVGCIKQMEPNLKNDDNILSEIGPVTDLQSTLLPDEKTRNLSVLEDVGDQPRLEDSSQSQEVELPVDGNASVLDPNSVSDQDRLHVTKGSIFADEKCNDGNTMEFDNLVNVPPDEKPHEDSSASEMQVDNMLTSVQNIITGSDELNNQDAPHSMMETSEGNPGSHVVSIDIRCRNEKAVEQATCHLEKPHYSVSEAKSVEKEIANEDSVLDVQEAGNMIPQGDSILLTMGGCRDGECPGVVAEISKCEDMVVFKETAVGGDQSKSNTYELSPTTYKNDTGYAIELMNSLAGNASGLDPILKGDSDLHSVDRCSDRESPDVLDETNKYEDVKDTDTGGDQSKSSTNELSQIAYKSDGGFEYSNSNAGLLSGLDPILKGDSDLHTVDVCSDKQCPEVPVETNKCERMVLVKDTDIGGDQSKVCTHDLSPMAYGSDTGNALDSVSSSVNPVLRTDNDLPTVDGCSERKCPDVAAETTKCEVKGTDTGGDQSNMSPHDSSPMAYRSDTGYVDEVRNSNSGISSSLDPRVKMTSGKSTNEDAVASGSQPDIEIFDRTSEAPMSVIEEIEVLKGRGDGNREVHSNLTATSTSAEMLSEVHATGASKSPHDGLGVSAEELNADSHASHSILGESSKACNENEVYEEGKSGECDQDLSYSEKDGTKFPSEANSIVLEVDGSVGKGVGSSLFCEDTTEKNLVVPTLKHEVDDNAPVADAPLESCNLASCGTINAVPVSSESGATSEVHNLSVVQSAPSPAVGSHSDNKEETAIKISKDANLSCTVSSPMVEVESAPGPVCEAEKGASCETAGQLFCKKLDQSLPISVSYNTESQREPGTAVADEISKRSTTDNSVQCELSVKKVDDAEAYDGATTENKSTAEDKSEKASADITEPNMNCDRNVTQLVPSPLVLMCDGIGKKAPEDSGTIDVSGDKNCAEAIVAIINSDALRNFEAPLPETHVKFGALESGERSTDPNQPDCGSPKVFGTIEPPEAKLEKGNIKGLTNQNAPDSNVVGDGGKHCSNSSNPTGNDLSNDQNYGTSDVSSFADFPKGNDANSSHAFPALPAPKIVEGSQTNSGSCQMDAKISQEISRGGPQASDGEIATGGSKGTTERKRRRAPSKGMGKESAKKGTVKATTPMRQAERGDKSSSVSLSKSGIFQFAQPSEIQYYGLVDSSSKTYSILTSSTSTLPDLNSSAPPSLVFQQPFTDLQQVQLRAQIFVYGALIQGTAPEEAYMVSAFGGPEGGRSIWENAWRVCIERLHSQKSTPINPETPLQSSSDVRFTGARVPDLVKQSAFQGKAISSPVGRASTKGILPTASPMKPISSPLWSIPTPACEAPQYGVVPRGSVMEYQQAHTALHSFQTSPIRNIVGHNSSWMSQSSFRGPWVAPPQSSAAEGSIHFSAFPSTESVLLTPVKETTVPQMSSIKHASSGLAGQTGGTTSVFAGASPLLDPKKVAAASSGEPSSQPRSRKRKKISDSKELGNITLQPLSQTESALTLTVTSSVSTSVAVTTPITFVPKAMPEKLVMSVSPMPSSDHLKTADLGLEQKATLSEETLSKAKEARQQAEEASAHAAAAVSHSQEIWNQLDKKKNSRLISDAEAKLAAAAVAVAAAAAVAKAAAAAANVAANAALQAVLMAEEAYGNPNESMRNFGTDGMNALGLATPASVFRVEDGTSSSSSILVAAREAARRRVEAASAASKRAENMDAIVKAAELAAEAVSQAGTVVAMGDPLPLSELVKAGPEGYWKVPKVSSEMVKKSNDRMREQSNLYTLGEDPNTSARRFEERQSEKKETQITEHKKLPTVGDKVTETIKSASPTAENDFEETAQASKDSSILEGSQVEVFKDGGGFGVGWFTATVLSLLDGNAHVCYTELQSDEGSEKLQEWVSLDGKEDKPPKIRVARLLTPSLEGTRKRRREAMADYTWSIGDKVDAWIQNSWWEGVVTEKNKKDETILKVHFPAQGETSHVKAWHLRPSLIWKDGEWVEWSSVRNDCSSMEDGMPQEKRIKLGSPTVEGKGKDKTFKSNVVDSGKPEEPRLLSLSANEKVFNIGKNTRIENKPDAARTNRTGLQKEGSVKFGIPKPKRKFMEVSKHYVANQSNKVNEANDSVKFAKYLMPQPSGFRALKNTSKIDTKDKEVAESKLKGLKSEKQRSVLDKTVPQKDNLLTDLVSAPGGSSKMDHTRKIRDSVRQAEGLSGKRNILETGSSYSSDGRAQGPVTFSSRTPSDFPLSKKVSSSTAKSERGNKGNFEPAGGKLGKIEDKGTSSNPANSTSEVVEPRRSNRRIQPTSRLLEGLQSSLSISKIPSISHDKGARSHNRNAFRGSNHD